MAADALPPGSLFIEQGRFQLSLLGVLLGSAGVRLENRLVEILTWLQERAKQDNKISLVKFEEMPAARSIEEDERRDIGLALWQLEIHEGHHGFGGPRWHMRVSGEIVNIAHSTNLREYLQARVQAIARRIAVARGLIAAAESDRDIGEEPSSHLSEVTRREIIDRFMADRTGWAGRLNEDDFLSRLYDLNALPSSDHRFETAAGDIWKHRVINSDWEPDWVFYDRRFNLLHGFDEPFLQFLCQTVHPAVRPNSEEALRLVGVFNEQLRRDGWELFPKREISGRPVFAARQTADEVEIFEEPTGWPKVDRQVGEIRLRLREATAEEQFQAVGHLCREALISVAQAVFDPSRHPPVDGVGPSATDAKRMLSAFFAEVLAGSGNDNARKHAHAAFGLANDVQHDRAATFQDAALCAEATLSVIRIIAIVSGRRERTDLSS